MCLWTRRSGCVRNRRLDIGIAAAALVLALVAMLAPNASAAPSLDQVIVATTDVTTPASSLAGDSVTGGVSPVGNGSVSASSPSDTTTTTTSPAPPDSTTPPPAPPDPTTPPPTATTPPPTTPPANPTPPTVTPPTTAPSPAGSSPGSGLPVANPDSGAGSSPVPTADPSSQAGSQQGHIVSTTTPAATIPATAGGVSGESEAPTISVSQGTAPEPSGNVAGAYSHISVSPLDSIGASGAIVDSASTDPHPGNANGATPFSSSGPAASGWMTARNPNAERDLIAGNFVGAYGLPSPASSVARAVIPVQSATLQSVIESVARHVHATATRRSKAGDGGYPPPPSALDPMQRGSRGPEGGVQSSSGGGGAASPLVLMLAFGLVASAWLKFVPRPTPHLVGAEAHRLERPG